MKIFVGHLLLFHCNDEHIPYTALRSAVRYRVCVLDASRDDLGERVNRQ